MTTENYVDISPDPAGSIRADLHREGFDYAKSFGELIDNSLDAEATRILIEINKAARRITITDNGKGCLDPHRMLRKGDSTKRARDGLGRYGVGLKHASYYIAGEDGLTTIITSHRGKHQMIEVKWGDLIKANSWKIRAPQVVSDNTVSQYLPERKGTRIMFTMAKGRGMLSSDQWENMLARLAFTFSPALREGRQIEVLGIGLNKPTLSAPRDPLWSESVSFDVEVGGKTARVRAGIKAPDDKSGQTGLAYVYRHRVIVANSALGCGQFNVSGVAGFVELDHSWALGQNKSEVTDTDMPQLAEKILERLRPLLEKAHNATRHIQSAALCNAASAALSQFAAACGYGKPRRPNKIGTKRVDPQKSSDREEPKVATVIGGPGKARELQRIGGGIVVETVTVPDDKRSGWVEPTTGRVFLNNAVPRVAEAITVGASEFVLIAAVHYIHWETSKPQQRVIGEDPPKSFDEVFGEFLAKQATLTMAQAV